MATFKVHGQIYHNLGSLQPLQSEPQFLQFYFMGNLQTQAEHRCGVIPGTQINIILPLQEMIHQVNTYVLVSNIFWSILHPLSFGPRPREEASWAA